MRGGEKASNGSGERRSIEEDTLDNRLQEKKNTLFTDNCRAREEKTFRQEVRQYFLSWNGAGSKWLPVSIHNKTRRSLCPFMLIVKHTCTHKGTRKIYHEHRTRGCLSLPSTPQKFAKQTFQGSQYYTIITHKHTVWQRMG